MLRYLNSTRFVIPTALFLLAERFDMVDISSQSHRIISTNINYLMQAQVGAALSPAFSGDSNAELLSAAVQVCAMYIGSGNVQEISTLGRVLKYLTNALALCQGRVYSRVYSAAAIYKLILTDTPIR